MNNNNYYNQYKSNTTLNQQQIDMNEGMGMDMGMGMWPGTSSRDILLADDIEKAIQLEAQAYMFYEKLATLAENERDRAVILGIQNDEARHYHWFTMILRRMGGVIPNIVAGDLPEDFEEGVRIAIMNELEAAEFYQSIAYRATDHHIDMHFMHASHDEQRHALLFENMLINMR
jgi:rubrerythrin